MRRSGSGHQSYACTATLAKELASATGGVVFSSTAPAKDLADGIINIVGTMAKDTDGDGVPDDKDPAPNDPCDPTGRPFACRARPVPSIIRPVGMMTRMAVQDEELPDGQDNDGDGLVDEDVGGPNCPFPPRTPR